MSAVLYLRPFRSRTLAEIKANNPALYASLVKRMKHDQEAGQSGYSPLVEVKNQPDTHPKEIA